MSEAHKAVVALQKTVEQSVVGQSHVVKSLIVALLAKGHILLEGLPGTAKTRSVKSLSKTLKAPFGRIQFTPDLLPSDVTGTEIYQEVDGRSQLRFQQGPIFNSIVLADEINRAPAKVQAALLEAMEEGTVTVGDQTHHLPKLFMVLATQNPIEQEGTYPLPEAQMDRFMMKVTVDYPDDAAELDIIRLVRGEEVVTATAEPVTIDEQVILEVRKLLPQVTVSELVEKYMVALTMATRHPERYPDSNLPRWIDVGSSPRASIALDKCSRAHAWLEGKDFVEPDDVRAIAMGVLGHRIILSYDALAEGVTATDVVNELLDYVVVG